MSNTQFERRIAVETASTNTDALIATERKLLGTILFWPEEHHIQTARDSGLSAASFYLSAHSLIFSAFSALDDAGQPTDTSGVFEFLGARKMNECGGLDYLTRLESAAPATPLFFKKEIEAVKDAAARRNFSVAALAFSEAIADPSRSVEELSELAKSSFAKITETSAAPGAVPLIKRPFITWSLNQFLDYQVPENQNILGEGYLQRGQWTSLIGVGGLGKTRATLWLCICTILGMDWLGIPTHCARARVLFLSTENGAVRWKNDLTRMTSGMTVSEKTLLNECLFILSLDGGGDEDDADPSLNMSDAVAVGRLQATMESIGPDIIVVDPLADMVGGDENSAEAMGECIRAIRRCQRLACPRAAGIAIHHARTGAGNVIQAGDNFNAGNFGRGSKALYSAVRAEIQMAPGDKDDSTKLVVMCGKSNDAPKFAPRGVIFDPESFRYAVDPLWNIDDWRADVNGKRSGTKTITISDVVELVAELAPKIGDEVSAGDVLRTGSDRFGGSEKTVSRRLLEAAQAGFVCSPRKGFYKLGHKPLPK